MKVLAISYLLSIITGLKLNQKDFTHDPYNAVSPYVSDYYNPTFSEYPLPQRNVIRDFHAPAAKSCTGDDGNNACKYNVPPPKEKKRYEIEGEKEE